MASFPLLGVLFSGPAKLADWSLCDYAAAGLTLGIYLVFGAAIASLSPNRWIISGLLSLLPVIFSLYNLVLAITDPIVRRGAPIATLVLVLPLAFALLGGHVGRTWVAPSLVRRQQSH